MKKLYLICLIIYALSPLAALCRGGDKITVTTPDGRKVVVEDGKPPQWLPVETEKRAVVERQYYTVPKLVPKIYVVEESTSLPLLVPVPAPRVQYFYVPAVYAVPAQPPRGPVRRAVRGFFGWPN